MARHVHCRRAAPLRNRQEDSVGAVDFARFGRPPYRTAAKKGRLDAPPPSVRPSSTATPSPSRSLSPILWPCRTAPNMSRRWWDGRGSSWGAGRGTGHGHRRGGRSTLSTAPLGEAAAGNSLWRWRWLAAMTVTVALRLRPDHSSDVEDCGCLPGRTLP